MLQSTRENPLDHNSLHRSDGQEPPLSRFLLFTLPGASSKNDNPNHNSPRTANGVVEPVLQREYPDEFREGPERGGDGEDGEEEVPGGEDPAHPERGSALHHDLACEYECEVQHGDLYRQRPVLRHPGLLVPEVEVLEEERVLVGEPRERVPRDELRGFPGTGVVTGHRQRGSRRHGHHHTPYQSQDVTISRPHTFHFLPILVPSIWCSALRRSG